MRDETGRMEVEDFELHKELGASLADSKNPNKHAIAVLL